MNLLMPMSGQEAVIRLNRKSLVAEIMRFNECTLRSFSEIIATPCYGGKPLRYNTRHFPSRMRRCNPQLCEYEVEQGGRVDTAGKVHFPGNLEFASQVSVYFGRVLSDSTKHWYAVHVKSRHEKVVETSLRGKGYEVFSPSYFTKRKRVDRTAEIEVPLFPGYVFCYFSSNKRLPILTTPGVVSVVGRGKNPEPLDDKEIASIRTLALSGRPVQPWPFLRSGQRIRLQSGPLMGAEGIFLRIKDEHHLIVSITLLQRAVSVVIEKEAVTPVFLRERPLKPLLDHKIHHPNF